MGVPQLWDHLPASSEQSLAQLAYTHNRFISSRGMDQMRIGIDVSIWLFQAKEAASLRPLEPSVKGAKLPNLPLLILFHKLAKLAALPLQPLFVFDGPHRPEFKRGKVISRGGGGVGAAGGKGKGKAGGQGKSLEAKFWRMVEDGFGWDCWRAPGEAEAELAALCRADRLDYVITEDVDALLFGCPRVLRRLKTKTANSKTLANDLRFTVINEDEIKTQLQVDWEGLVLVGLMSGGDYDQVGIRSLGPTIALALARAGFSSDLMTAYRTLPEATLISDFLPEYRARLAAYLHFDPDKLIGRRNPALAKTITDTFPNLQILEQYVRPVVGGRGGHAAWGGFGSGERGNRMKGELRLEEVCVWMEGELAFEGREAVLKKARAVLWEGAVCRSLLGELEDPGSWAEGCKASGLEKVQQVNEDGVSLAQLDRKITEFFKSVKYIPLDSAASIKSSESLITPPLASPLSSPLNALRSSSLTPPPTPKIPFDASSRSYPLISRITLEKDRANSGLDEYRVEVDVRRFCAEIEKGLGDPADFANAPSGSQGGSRPPSESESDGFGCGGWSQPSLSQASAAASSKSKGKGKAAPRTYRATSLDLPSDEEVSATSSGDDYGALPPSSQSKSSKAPPAHSDPLLLWMPKSLVLLTFPDLHHAFVTARDRKEAEKEEKAERARRRRAGEVVTPRKKKPVAAEKAKPAERRKKKVVEEEAPSEDMREGFRRYLEGGKSSGTSESDDPDEEEEIPMLKSRPVLKKKVSPARRLPPPTKASLEVIELVSSDEEESAVPPPRSEPFIKTHSLPITANTLRVKVPQNDSENNKHPRHSPCPSRSHLNGSSSSSSLDRERPPSKLIRTNSSASVVSVASSSRLSTTAATGPSKPFPPRQLSKTVSAPTHTALAEALAEEDDDYFPSASELFRSRSVASTSAVPTSAPVLSTTFANVPSPSTSLNESTPKKKTRSPTTRPAIISRAISVDLDDVMMPGVSDRDLTPKAQRIAESSRARDVGGKEKGKEPGYVELSDSDEEELIFARKKPPMVVAAASSSTCTSTITNSGAPPPALPLLSTHTTQRRLAFPSSRGSSVHPPSKKRNPISLASSPPPSSQQLSRSRSILAVGEPLSLPPSPPSAPALETASSSSSTRSARFKNRHSRTSPRSTTPKHPYVEVLSDDDDLPSQPSRALKANTFDGFDLPGGGFERDGRLAPSSDSLDGEGLQMLGELTTSQLSQLGKSTMC